MRGEVAGVLEHSRKVQELMAGCIKRHFESIPEMMVLIASDTQEAHNAIEKRFWQLSNRIRDMFKAFDADSDGFLDQKETKAAFASMVKDIPWYWSWNFSVFIIWTLLFYWWLKTGQICHWRRIAAHSGRLRWGRKWPFWHGLLFPCPAQNSSDLVDLNIVPEMMLAGQEEFEVMIRGAIGIPRTATPDLGRDKR